jgi:hypothetical protein
MNNPNNPFNKRPAILDAAELNILTTRSTWSDPEANPLLDAQSTKTFYITDEKGQRVRDENGNELQYDERLIALYGMFTVDVRLANLNSEEIDFVREHMDLAHDLMASGHKKASMVVYERAISVMESSHSKAGWFRKMLGTVTMENKTEYSEPKKSFMGGNKQ